MRSNVLAYDRLFDQDRTGWQESHSSLDTMGVRPKLEHDQECVFSRSKALRLIPQGGVYRQTEPQLHSQETWVLVLALVLLLCTNPFPSLGFSVPT